MLMPMVPITPMGMGVGNGFVPGGLVVLQFVLDLVAS